MKFSIRLKLVAFTFCVVLLVGGSISLYSIYQGRERVLTTFEKNALETTALISKTVVNDLYSLNIRSLRARLESARANPDVSYTSVTDVEGVVVTDGTRENALRDQKLTDGFSQKMLRSGGWISQVEEGVLKVGGPILMPDGERIGFLHVAFSLTDPERVLRETTMTSLYITAICLAIGAILALMLATGFSRPILSILRASKEIGEGKLDVRVPFRRGDELGMLADTIHHMGRNLQARYKELETLQQLGQSILTSPDLKAVLARILDQALLVGSFDIGVIRLLDTGGQILEPVVLKGFQDPRGARAHPVRDATTGKVISRVMSWRKPQVLENISEYGGMRTLKHEGVQSAIVIPVYSEEQILGVMQFGSRTPRKFTPDEIRLFEAIGNQMGIAVQKARLFDETERRAKHLSALHTVASTVSTSLDLDQLVAKALDIILQVTGMDAGDIRLLEGDPLRLDIKVHKGVSSELVEKMRRGARATGEAEQVLTTRRSLVFGSNQTSGLEMPRQALSEGFTTAVWVPIVSRDKAFGIIALAARGDRPFNRNQLPLLESIGASLGVALDNARLFEETQRNLERVRALHAIDMAITSSLDLQAVLDVLLEKIDLVLPYSATTVRLFNKKSGLLEPVACRNLDEGDWKAEPWRAGHGMPNIVFETNGPVITKDVQTDPRVKDPEFFRKHGLVSYLGVPLVAKDEILGVISFYTKEEHEFSNEEVEFLTTLAGQAAIAIHNSQLYEEMRDLAGELARSNKVKDEFLSVMSHELRTPLSVVLGYAGMMKEGLFGDINPEQGKALEKIISRGGDQLAMISGILRVTQIEAEKVKAESRDFDLRDFLDDLRCSYEVPLGKDVRVQWDYPRDLPMIRTDGEKLKHILQNLINNAIKFTAKGSVKVSARVGEYSNEAEFEVADTGIGIPKGELASIFEKFRQVDSSETRPYGGVGLGLYIVRQYTRLLGGKVDVESEPGEGTILKLTIPCEVFRASLRREAQGLRATCPIALPACAP